MEYLVIKTKFGKDSIFVPSEKMLYVSKGREQEFICYQSVLADSKKKDQRNHIPCSARIRLLPNGTCERKNVFVPHSAHLNHESIVIDKKIMENVVQKAVKLRTDYAEDAYRVPNRHIFQREVARYSIIQIM